MTEKDFYIIIVFLIIPFSSFLLCFLNDEDRSRKKIMNWFLVGNALIFLSPLTSAYVASLPNGDMWSENGPGTVLWYYLLLTPICYGIQALLFVLKIIFSRENRNGKGKTTYNSAL